MAVEVRNKKGTSDHTPSCCDSWIDHFRSVTGKAGKQCYATDCTNTDDLVGAHVYQPDQSDDVRIVPLCNECNKRTDTFKVIDRFASTAPCS